MGLCGSVGANGDGLANTFHARYKLGEKLGEGNFGQVRIAKSRTTKIAHAVKIIDVRTSGIKGKCAIDETKLRDARQEADAMLSVGNHAHCVRLIETFAEESLFYMVMEKCEACLMDRLDQMARANEEYVTRLFREMLCAIAYVHEMNFVHCDIKPNNFLLGGAKLNTVKLTDFGLARKMLKRGYLTCHCGTAPYMSPEVVGRKRYDFKTDVWSMGVTAYVLLYGDFPYLPEVLSSEAMKELILTGEPAPSFLPASRGAPVPSERAKAFVQMLMAREQDGRCTANEALQSPFFNASLRTSADQANDFIPTFKEARKRTRRFKQTSDSQKSPADLDELLSDLQAKTERLAKSTKGGQDLLWTSDDSRNSKGTASTCTSMPSRESGVLGSVPSRESGVLGSERESSSSTEINALVLAGLKTPKRVR